MRNFAELNAAVSFETHCGFTLMPLQVQAIDELAPLARTAFFSDVGTGKTVQSTAISMLREPEITLVLVPPIILIQWERWLNKFGEQVLRFQGTPVERKKMNLATRWVIMSHAIFRVDYDRIYQELSKHRLDIIVDEAQFLKSVRSRLYNEVTRLAVGQTLQLLTGTPTSTPIDAYAYIKLKTPKQYRSMGHFESLHVETRDFFGKPTKFRDLELVAQNLAFHTVKQSRRDFGYKNEALFPDTMYELSAGHMKLYKKLVEEQLLLLDDGTKLDMTSATKLYHALQQVVLQYDYFSGDETKRSSTYDLLDETVEEIGDSKLIVWTVYKRTSRAVTAYLNARGVKTVAAYSEVDSNRSFEAFMTDLNVQVLVAQYQSAGAGLNAQSVCNEMLVLELSTTPMLMKQAFGRICRLGQTKIPRIKIAVAKGTIQEALVARLLDNDAVVSKVERTVNDLRKVLYGG